MFIKIIRNKLQQYIPFKYQNIIRLNMNTSSLIEYKKVSAVRIGVALSLSSFIYYKLNNIKTVLCDKAINTDRVIYKSRDAVVDAYVKKILQNPSLNIYGIPDNIEEHIYKFTVKLTLDAILYWISSLNGLEILGHQIELDYVIGQNIPEFSTTSLNHKALDTFVSSLLKEEKINIVWLPDAVEHKLYFNCLLLMLTVLHSSLGSLNIHFVGHKIAIGLEAVEVGDLVSQASRRRSGLSEKVLDELVSSLLKRSVTNNLHIILLPRIYIVFAICHF
jgi:hypothetical protein